MYLTCQNAIRHLHVLTAEYYSVGGTCQQTEKKSTPGHILCLVWVVKCISSIDIPVHTRAILYEVALYRFGYCITLLLEHALL